MFLKPFVEIDTLSLRCFLTGAILNREPLTKIRGLGANPKANWQTVKRVACVRKSGGGGDGGRGNETPSPLFPFGFCTPSLPFLFLRRPLRLRREQLLVAQCYIVRVKLGHDYQPAFTRLSTIKRTFVCISAWPWPNTGSSSESWRIRDRILFYDSEGNNSLNTQTMFQRASSLQVNRTLT